MYIDAKQDDEEIGEGEEDKEEVLIEKEEEEVVVDTSNCFYFI